MKIGHVKDEADNMRLVVQGQVLVRDVETAAQHAVAEAMLAFHDQLRACFRGDFPGVVAAHRRSRHYTLEAIRLAREALGSDPLALSDALDALRARAAEVLHTEVNER